MMLESTVKYYHNVILSTSQLPMVLGYRAHAKAEFAAWQNQSQGDVAGSSTQSQGLNPSEVLHPSTLPRLVLDM